MKSRFNDGKYHKKLLLWNYCLHHPHISKQSAPVRMSCWRIWASASTSHLPRPLHGFTVHYLPWHQQGVYPWKMVLGRLDLIYVHFLLRWFSLFSTGVCSLLAAGESCIYGIVHSRLKQYCTPENQQNPGWKITWQAGRSPIFIVDTSPHFPASHSFSFSGDFRIRAPRP